mmetsp:Transcript_4986/g.7557  ORF Transcript_4986/g.7557 Transcript_4986/m.7557 type:complete len:208 (+) Transcript_4986:1624-2247(+)
MLGVTSVLKDLFCAPQVQTANCDQPHRPRATSFAFPSSRECWGSQVVKELKLQLSPAASHSCDKFCVVETCCERVESANCAQVVRFETLACHGKVAQCTEHDLASATNEPSTDVTVYRLAPSASFAPQLQFYCLSPNANTPFSATWNLPRTSFSIISQSSHALLTDTTDTGYKTFTESLEAWTCLEDTTRIEFSAEPDRLLGFSFQL